MYPNCGCTVEGESEYILSCIFGHESRYGDEQKAVLRGYMLALRRTNSHAHAVLAGVVPLDDFLRRPFPQLVAVGTADEAREALGHAAYVIKKFHVLDVVKEVLLQ
jgi:hypothetical protein